MYRQLMDRLVEGERPKDIAIGFGVPLVVLRGWIEKNCPDDVSLASRARADDLEWLATNAVENASPDEVPLARLKADHYMKVAAKLNPARWGDGETRNVGGGIGAITIVIGDVKPQGGITIEGVATDGNAVELDGN